MKQLSPRQSKFVTLYLRTGNATQAYKAAGYKSKSPGIHAGQLMKNSEVAAAIAVRRASTEIVIARKTVADILELEEHLTLEVRGTSYFDRIARMESRLAKKEKALAALELSVQDPKVDAATKAILSARILAAHDKLIEDENEIARTHIAGRAESNKAAVALLKVKGAFDPKRTPVDDPVALLNQLARNIIRSRYRPTQLIEDMKRQVKDAALSIRPGDATVDVDAAAGGSGRPDRGALFVRPSPESASS